MEHERDCDHPRLPRDEADKLLEEEHARADREQLFYVQALHDCRAEEERRDLHIALHGDDRSHRVGVARDLGQLIGQERRHTVKRQTEQRVAEEEHAEVIPFEGDGKRTFPLLLFPVGFLRGLFFGLFAAHGFLVRALVVHAEDAKQNERDIQNAVEEERILLRPQRGGDATEDDAHRGVADRAQKADRAVAERAAAGDGAHEPSVQKARRRVFKESPRKQRDRRGSDGDGVRSGDERHDAVEHGADRDAQQKHAARRAQSVAQRTHHGRGDDADAVDQRHDETHDACRIALFLQIGGGKSAGRVGRPEEQFNARKLHLTLGNDILQIGDGRKAPRAMFVFHTDVNFSFTVRYNG